jgi:anti-anti-sigma factor
MSPLARVSDEQAGALAIAVVQGEIDASNARELGERLRGSLTNHGHALVVDLAGTTYIDSAGINLLFELELDLRQRRQQLHLVVPTGSPVGRVIEIVGLDATVATHPTREAALEHASSDG